MPVCTTFIHIHPHSSIYTIFPSIIIPGRKKGEKNSSFLIMEWEGEGVGGVGEWRCAQDSSWWGWRGVSGVRGVRGRGVTALCLYMVFHNVSFSLVCFSLVL